MTRPPRRPPPASGPTDERGGAAAEHVLAQALGGAPRPEADLGPFRPLRTLGEGATGRVLLARVLQPTCGVPAGRLVALKVLHPALCRSPTARRRFDREARLGARVRDPRVVRILGATRVRVGGASRAVLVMEPAVGVTLERLLADGRPRTLAASLPLVADVARALRAVHHVGLVHRDVKPSNVVRGADGRARLLDLGLATARADAGRLTLPTQFVGTLAYAAPERLAGARRRPDPRWDLYALGVLWIDLLTGTRGRGIGPPAARLPAGLPRAAAALLRDLVAARPADRPASAAAVLRRLRRLGVAATDRRAATRGDAPLPTTLALDVDRLRYLAVGRRSTVQVADGRAARRLVARLAAAVGAPTPRRPTTPVLRATDAADGRRIGRALEAARRHGRACIVVADAPLPPTAPREAVAAAEAATAAAPVLVVRLERRRARTPRARPVARRRALARVLGCARSFARPFEASEAAAALRRPPLEVALDLAELARTTGQVRVRGRFFVPSAPGSSAR